MIVAGIGCKRGTGAADIEAAIRAALARGGLAIDRLGAIATIAIKEDEFGIAAVAKKLGLRLVLVPEHELKKAAPHTRTKSERVVTLIGVPSVAEAAALAAAGTGARLIVARLVAGSATCALASTEA